MAKSKLTPETQAKIVEAIEGGNYAEIAAMNAGIHKATYYRWMERGEEAKQGQYRDFCDAVKAAEAKAESNAVDLVVKAGHDSWQAAMTYLERRFPERWRRRETQEITGRESGPVEIIIGGTGSYGKAQDTGEDTP